jgi:hypothetical protein
VLSPFNTHCPTQKGPEGIENDASSGPSLLSFLHGGCALLEGEKEIDGRFLPVRGRDVIAPVPGVVAFYLAFS